MPPEDQRSQATARARSHVVADHADLVEAVAACADQVAGAWETPPTDRAGVVEPLREVLAETGALEGLPGLLAGAVEAAGYELRAAPVAAPPYVAVTSVGPVCRATVADGRLVVTFELFVVDRSGDEPTYRRRDCSPTESVVVALRD
ncbi:hypothetical protein [Haloarchaeobius iranensis]|uniref:DUF7988 domain-containing protein n=1 Tax=Haloarchaeobius iranensis TaxID=996166 RepID=A0A1G9VVY5_9EURY|nr:hypothetical protein [Haloarchaeobius iranensis]SDM76037.1 hypothetical protein SAMN05192554_10717 [Haloarchaeobius iranensis]